jgi:hypothetical protein
MKQSEYIALGFAAGSAVVVALWFLSKLLM